MKYYQDVREGRAKGVSIKDYRAYAVKSLQNYILGKDDFFCEAAEIKDKPISEPNKSLNAW